MLPQVLRCALTCLLQAEDLAYLELLKRIEDLARDLVDRQHFLDNLELAMVPDSSDEDEYYTPDGVGCQVRPDRSAICELRDS